MNGYRWIVFCFAFNSNSIKKTNINCLQSLIKSNFKNKQTKKKLFKSEI